MEKPHSLRWFSSHTIMMTFILITAVITVSLLGPGCIDNKDTDTYITLE